MVVQCDNCGAPLDVKPGKSTVRCCYCGKSNNVHKTQVVNQQTPQNWRPPQQWTPPPQFQAPSVPLNYSPAKAAKASVMITLIIIGATTILPLVFILGPQLKSSIFKWDGKDQFHCTGNDDLTISGVKVKAKKSPAIIVDVNCSLVIKDSTISGKNLIEVRSNGEVTIEDSKLTVSGARGVLADGNSDVIFRNSQLRVRPDGSKAIVVGVKADGNGTIEFADSTLELRASEEGRKVVAIRAGGNKSIRMRDSSILYKDEPEPGELTLFHLEGNANAEVEGGEILADDRPLWVRTTRGVTISGTDLEGKIERSGHGTVTVD